MIRFQTKSPEQIRFAEKVLEILNDDVTKSLPEGWQDIDSTERATAWIEERQVESSCFTVLERATEELIGFVFLYEFGAESTRVDLRIGFLLAASTWGKGFGSELIQGLVAWCKRDSAVRSLSGGVERHNLGSIRVLEKNGFKRTQLENSGDDTVFFELNCSNQAARTFLLLSIGTRGDMEPFLAIGELLVSKGHNVVCAFPEQFRDLSEESRLEFITLGSEFIDMLESDAGKAALGGGGSGVKKFFALIKLARNSTEINKDLVLKQADIVEQVKPDTIIYNGKAIYPILWQTLSRGNTVLISPVPFMHYVKERAHVAFNMNLGRFFNKLTYSLADFGLVTTAMISGKWLKLKSCLSRKQVKKTLKSNKAIYTISPSLFPRPHNWKDNLKVLGYHERNKSVHWKPGRQLGDFIEKHNRLLLITFGSMTNPEPEKKTRLILDILEHNNIPAIINTAAGGLVELENVNSGLVHFVSQIPYDWIFPKVYGVVHHGGSGTTHTALKNGCVSLVIPHIIDQFVWNSIVAELGAGPKGPKISKLTRKTFEPLILELLNNKSYKIKAEEISKKIQNENLGDDLYSALVD